ncbi:MAG: RagB/SusD family nutrient uptake outer membrane protein [Ginsengibacter sp.]
MKLNINILSRVILLISIVCFFSACKKSLNEQNKSAITQESYFTNEAQAQSAVNGVYPMLQTLQTGNGLNYGEAPFVSLEMISGQSTTLGQSLYNNGLIKHNNSPIEPVFKVLWVGFYNGIANANVAINRIPSIKMNDAGKSSLLGEVYFLRALYYYYLLRIYGDVPLITNPIDYSSQDLYPVRTPAKQVYDTIVSDLLRAEKTSLPNIDKTGRASLGAVKSLLASVYLTMAGYPLNLGAPYYQLAADKSKEVIDSKWYKLFTDYAYLHDRAHKNTDEFIFQIQYKNGIATNNITEFVTPDKIGISKLPSEIGALMPRAEFVNSYEPNDKRAEEQQFYFSKYPAASGNGTTIDFGGYALYKFFLLEAAGPNGDGNSDQNWTLLRLPEVLLIYAEASNEISGPTQIAFDQVNLIRSRADLPALSGLNKDEFREAIWRERYHELAYENKSYFDIQRTRKAYNLSTGHFEDALTYKNESGVVFNQQYLLWPIPQTEIDANPKLTQNPGW